MSFDDDLAALNEWHFFREFTYSKSTFRPLPSEEKELADAIIWIGELLAVYQLKERVPPENMTEETEIRWFKKKVIGVATRQIRDTLAYLSNYESIQIENQRGHKFDLEFQSIQNLHKLVVYRASEKLPTEYRQQKHHRSATAGFIHLINATDYIGIVRTLLTPAEVVEYLEFRKSIVERWDNEVSQIPEPALVGQYLDGRVEDRPSLDFYQKLILLEHRSNEWDMSGIISKFPDRITTDNKPTDYYQIVRELALLKRNELREFKTRFELSLEKARSSDITLPYRMAVPRTNCGFVFVPITTEALPHRRNALQNFTLANKYDLRLPRCIGVSIADDVDGWFTVEWMYVEFPWEHEAEMDKLLEENFPFRDVKTEELSRFSFRNSTNGKA